MTDTPQLGSFVRELSIAEVIEETADAKSIVFDVPAGAEDDFRYTPGQFLTLRIPSDQTGSVARCYSLSSSPTEESKLKVTVKRTVDGYGSNWLCDNAEAGMAMHVLAPSGIFTPKNLDQDFILLAAGSGITPVMSILKSALAQGTGHIVMVYANRDEKSVIFKDELQTLQRENPDRLTVLHWLESVSGIPSPEMIGNLLHPVATKRHSYICGPAPFMETVKDGLRRSGADMHLIHTEVFSSIEGDPFAEIVIDDSPGDDGVGPATAIVELDDETHEISWPRNTPLLDVLLSKGIKAPFSCRKGECSACACVLKSGEVEMIHNGILDPEEVEEGYVLSCQLLPKTDRVEVSYSE
ncbi:ferredoxin--NADP reductase [Dietzia sp. PP-33]|jgi:3-ketosteroid 9alpha-monooxygenase subunit B|uniref:ferredoxin--NADP reductase n=1 Tax=Dietzia sp. PP-33 TaxID=2957500 RepID=UPI0029A0B2F9|nr:ferredoxin--NADP reductase [Dietzia sp. PP-33]MDX2356970.1 ferredoxin--NADP reductase [Dietzia sp. PP-33]